MKNKLFLSVTVMSSALAFSTISANAVNCADSTLSCTNQEQQSDCVADCIYRGGGTAEGCASWYSTQCQKNEK